MYDSGEVYFWINGVSGYAGYGQNSNADTVASAIMSAVNGNSFDTTASPSGNEVILTADGGIGPQGDFSLSTQVGWDTRYFGQPSFTATPSGSNFTGGAGSLGTSPLVTLYSYDAMNNLTCAVQKGTDTTSFTSCAAAPLTWRPRSFAYDSLSRMTSSQNPEAGTITYSYDVNGNMATKTDARSITVTYDYDVLNRELSRTYSNGDPTVSTVYDGSNCLSLPACQNVGKRTSVSDGAGAETWAYQVDKTNLRSVHQEQRTNNSAPSNITKTTTYYFNLAGGITQIVYPTGRTINYTYDAAGRLGSAADGSNGITYVTGWQSPPANCTADAVCYDPPGDPSAISIGQASSFTGFNISETYNNRQQPSNITASSSAGEAINITYNYVDPSSKGNAGVVYGITNNLNSSRSQTFTYDQLNRLSSAGTSATTGAYCWGYQFSYDNWGNLLSQAGWSPTYDACTESVMGAVNAGNNNQLSSFTYDASGNTYTDGSYSYTWNGDSQMKTAAGMTYTYDGDGRRAAKVGTKLYWYGSGGEILAETDAAGNTQNEYVYFGGKRVAVVPASGSVLYYAEDLLESSRVIVESNGTLCYDADFTPFGSERAYTNTCSQNYKFQGKERDTETQNDNFEAREYSWRAGRWLSADWSSVPVAVPYAKLSNPQTLNLYSMVANDPESFADLDGHGPPYPGWWGWGDMNFACIIQNGDYCSTQTNVGISNGAGEANAEAASQQNQAQNTVTVEQVQGQGANVADHAAITVNGQQAVGLEQKKDSATAAIEDKTTPGAVKPVDPSRTVKDKAVIPVTPEQAAKIQKFLDNAKQNPPNFNLCTIQTVLSSASLRSRRAG